MIKLFFVLLLFSFTCCSKAASSFEFHNMYPVNLKDTICINSTDCFYFRPNSNYSKMLICQCDKVIDSIELTPYSTILYSFKSETDYILLFKNEGEFYPTFNAYYAKDHKLTSIGDFNVYAPCDSCDTFDYSIKDICISKSSNDIKFSFLKDAYSREKDDDWIFYNLGDLIISFDVPK